MIKKGLVALAMASALAPAQARFDGFQLGGTVGAVLMKGTHHYLNTVNTASIFTAGGLGPFVALFPSIVIADQRVRISQLGILMGGHAAYIAEFGTARNFVGAEIYVMFPGGNPVGALKNNAPLLDNYINAIPVIGPALAILAAPLLNSLSNDGSFNIKHKQAVGMVMILGTQLNPKIAVYGRIGIERGLFTAVYKSRDLRTFPVAQISAKQQVNAFVLGIGGSYSFSKHFIMSLEFNMPFYRKIFFLSDQTLLSDGTHFSRILLTYKPMSYRLGLKFAYRF